MILMSIIANIVNKQEDARFKNRVDQFRAKPELTYANFMSFIVRPLVEVQYQFIKMEDILSLPSSFRDDAAVGSQKYSFIRHDIDLDPKRAVDLARHEYSNGTAGTYHFISNSAQCPYDINDHVDDVIKIISLGHEVGLHFNFRSHPELVQLQDERSRQNGKQEENSELGHSFKRPSKGITVEDCLEHIGTDAAYLADIVNQRLQTISSEDLSQLTQGNIRKSSDNLIEIKNSNTWSPLPSLKVSSFSYHMPPKGVIAHNKMIFDIPLPNAQIQKMVYGYYKGFMENAEHLTNRYRTDISAGGTAINHFGTPYHAYSETIEKGIAPPPIIMINNHPEYWREEATTQADVLKEYINRIATLKNISFEEADQLMQEIKGESYFEHSEPSVEEKAIEEALQEGLLEKKYDGQLYTVDGTNYVPPSMRSGTLSREQYFSSLVSQTDVNSHIVLGSYTERPPLKEEVRDYSDLHSFVSPNMRNMKSYGSNHRWLMAVSADGDKKLSQYNLNTQIQSGKEAARALKERTHFDIFNQEKPGILTNNPYYKTFDFGVVVPITQKQHSVLTIDFFVKQRTLTGFSFANIGNGRECESAAYTALEDIGLNLDDFIPIDNDRRLSQIFQNASYDTIRRYNKVTSQPIKVNTIANVIREQTASGTKISIEKADIAHDNGEFDSEVQNSDRYLALFPVTSKTGIPFVIMAAPHIESKAPIYQTLPFNGDLDTYSRPFLDIPAAWDILQRKQLITSDESGVCINTPLNAEEVSLDSLMKKKRAQYQAPEHSRLTSSM